MCNIMKTWLSSIADIFALIIKNQNSNNMHISHTFCICTTDLQKSYLKNCKRNYQYNRGAAASPSARMPFSQFQ